MGSVPLFRSQLHWGGHCDIVQSELKLFFLSSLRATSSVRGRSCYECLRGIVVPLFVRGCGSVDAEVDVGPYCRLM